MNPKKLRRFRGADGRTATGKETCLGAGEEPPTVPDSIPYANVKTSDTGKDFCQRIDSAVMPGREIVMGVSGASGALLAHRFLEIALRARGLKRVHLVLSEASLEVARNELGGGIATGQEWVSSLGATRAARARIQLHDNREIGASIASGSYPVSGMIVIPCSAGTLGAIANGISRDLLQRAADVTLKERRPLVLAFRESPYSLVHIENMRRAALAGAILAPPSPAFYIARPSVERFLDAYCTRIARLLGLDVPGEDYRWKGKEGKVEE